MSLITRYPLWLAIFAILLGIAYALLLYHKNNNVNFEKPQRILLASLRGLAVSLLAFLLLAPMLKLVRKETDKPIIVISADNSESIISNKDSAFYKSAYPQQLQKLINDLEKDFEVVTYLSGNTASLTDNANPELDFSDKSTNLSSVFDEINLLYSNRNVGAVVMLTDGIFNNGANPYYSAQKTKFPIYTVGLGSDEQSVDLYISDIIHNKEVLKGNRTPVEVKIQAGKLAGKSFNVTVSDNKTAVFSKTINITGNNFFETISFFVEAPNEGILKYKIDLDELDGELTHKNNHAQFFIRVLDSKDKIAIIYDSPHPDVAAIRSALELSENYEIDVFDASEFNARPNDYNLLILHQLPSNKHQVSNILKEIRQNNISSLYIIGEKTDLSAFNSQNAGLQITQSKKLVNNSTPSFNNNFMLFTFSEEAQQLLHAFPPVQSPFATYKTAVSANVFMTQKISGVETQYPLIVFNNNNGRKSGIITGTGIWSWKIYDYVNNHNHDAFNEIITKSAMFLENKDDRSPFRVRHNMTFAENAPVEFFAELYNESAELINTPDVKMSVKGGGDTIYDALFSKQNNAYYLNMGELPVGTYSWNAKTQIGNKTYEKSGNFTIQEIFTETANLVADFDLLKNIANTTNAKFFSKEDISKVANEIKKNENIRPVATYNKKYSMLLNSPWYFVAIILLLGAEWFMRKWYGGY